MQLQYYSLLLAGLVLLAVAGLVLFRKKPKPTDWLAFLGLAAVLVIAWLAIRPTQTPLMGEAGDVQKMIGAGRPVLLEFQSPY